MERLRGPIRGYAWGSHTAIATIQGRPAPTPEPEAELWLGAHPDSPATLDGSGERLDAAIEADPTRLLGPQVAAVYGPRLPFLLKVLAAERPLSLQAHPDPVQAAAGFAAEEEAGTPRGERNYMDSSHKPELLVAVEPFEALCGFRPPGEAADEIAALGVPALKSIVDALRGPDEAEALRSAVDGLLTLPEPGPVVEAAAGSGHDLVAGLAEQYPTDIGVIVALLLNHVRLAPGEAVWMPAGNMHAYLRGVGVEIMAASDNVLRGGLTPKRIDVPELLRILRFEVLADPVLRAEPVSPEVRTWPVPVRDFALFHAAVSGSPVRVPATGPRIALCLRGEVTVADGDRPVPLRAGEAAFAAAGEAPLLADGTGDVYVATTG